jgi:hypothetical protein
MRLRHQPQPWTPSAFRHPLCSRPSSELVGAPPQTSLPSHEKLALNNIIHLHEVECGHQLLHSLDGLHFALRVDFRKLDCEARLHWGSLCRSLKLESVERRDLTAAAGAFAAGAAAIIGTSLMFKVA